jgi:DNA-binding FrmR family transcriptional regulator
MRKRTKEDAKMRLARMQGQVKGIVNMIDDDRECIDILTQIAALRAALEGLGALILTKHVEEMMADSSGDDNLQERVGQIREALARFLK